MNTKCRIIIEGERTITLRNNEGHINDQMKGHKNDSAYIVRWVPSKPPIGLVFRCEEVLRQCYMFITGHVGVS